MKGGKVRVTTCWKEETMCFWEVIDTQCVSVVIVRRGLWFLDEMKSTTFVTDEQNAFSLCPVEDVTNLVVFRIRWLSVVCMKTSHVSSRSCEGRNGSSKLVSDWDYGLLTQQISIPMGCTLSHMRTTDYGLLTQQISIPMGCTLSHMRTTYICWIFLLYRVMTTYYHIICNSMSSSLVTKTVCHTLYDSMSSSVVTKLFLHDSSDWYL
jgi:hypothetical protein